MPRARLAFTLLCAALLATGSRASQSAAEVRALWVVRTTLVSPAAITSMVVAARDAGFNTLLVQVRGRGDAFYDSRVEPRASALASQPEAFDPLAQVLREAHAAGLKVHAWVNVNLVADVAEMPTSRRHVVHRHPEWLMVPDELAVGAAAPRSRAFLPALVAWTKTRSASVEGLYASPVTSAAADHVAAVVADLASRYAVDGVHLDYLRYPGPEFDCSRAALDEFSAELKATLPGPARRDLESLQRRSPLAPTERYPLRWEAFRRQRLTRLLQRLRAVVMTYRPGATLSAAVVPDAAAAVSTRLQDWPGWAAQGLLDVICPMAYSTDAATFQQQIERARLLARDRGLWAGIGAYRLTGDQTVAHIAAARSLKADGVILFSYDSLVSAGRGIDTLARIGQHAFGQ